MGKHHRPTTRTDDRLRKDYQRARKTEPGSHDTYQKDAKARDAVVCSRCGVVCHAGRWYWGQPPLTDVHDGLCPACERIRDRYPAGTLRLPAAFLAQREEVVGLIRNAEEVEKREHPLERLMEMEEGLDGGMVVTTTGVHLARALANALERRFHRQARIRYPEEQNLVQVDWEG